MGIPRNNAGNIKRLRDQQKKHSQNPKMVENLQGRIDTLVSKEKKR